MANSGPFDIVVLGVSGGGYACALRAAELGRSVALIERDESLGGTCLNRGCIPTKALLHAAEVADHARDAAKFGVKTTFEGIDVVGVNAYKDKVVSTTVRGLTGLIKSRGIEVVHGTGRLTGPTTVEVTSPDGGPPRSRAGTSCSAPGRSRRRCPAWRSTASASSPATTRCGWSTSRRPSSSSAAA